VPTTSSRTIRCSAFHALDELEKLAKVELRDSTFAGWHVHGQVSWGAIIRTDIDDAGSDEADRAYRSINSKRADMVVTDNCGIPAAIIEYNGGGHYGDDPEKTRRRDRVKVIVAEKADVNLVKLLPAMDDQTKRQLLFRAFVEYQIKKNKRPSVNSVNTVGRFTHPHRNFGERRPP
jgi:hypothetical protein